MEPIVFLAGHGTALQMDGWMGGGEWAQILLMVVWALLLAVVVLVVGRVLFVPVVEELDFDRNDRDDGDSALATLRERYARGEIDEEEFERRASYLRGRGTRRRVSREPTTGMTTVRPVHSQSTNVPSRSVSLW